MRSKLQAVFSLTLLAGTSLFAGGGLAADRSILVVNGGDSAISEVHLSPVNKSRFGRDLLYESILVDESRIIQLNTPRCIYDLNVVFEGGQTNHLSKINLCSTRKLFVSEAEYKINPRRTNVKSSTKQPATKPPVVVKQPTVVAELPPPGKIPREALASRTFVGPDPLPPKGLGAYGIVAFPARIPQDTEKRALMVCRAYWATLPEVSELSAPLRMQMVTVWPVNDQSLAAKISAQRDVGICQDAVRHYHLPTALAALKQADPRAGAFQDRGPYLLAWSPASKKGEIGAVVLIADLSSATTFDQFSEYFRKWREDIEQSPDLWQNGWSIDGVRIAIRDWADRWGESILTMANGSE